MLRPLLALCGLVALWQWWESGRDHDGYEPVAGRWAGRAQ
jgi:hypothetical protein